MRHFREIPNEFLPLKLPNSMPRDSVASENHSAERDFVPLSSISENKCDIPFVLSSSALTPPLKTMLMEMTGRELSASKSKVAPLRNATLRILNSFFPVPRFDFEAGTTFFGTSATTVIFSSFRYLAAALVMSYVLTAFRPLM